MSLSIHSFRSSTHPSATHQATSSSSTHTSTYAHNFTGARRRIIQQLIDKKILLQKGGLSPGYVNFCMPSLSYKERAIILAEFAKIHASTLGGETSYFSFRLLLQNFLQRISQEKTFQAYEVSKAYIVGSYVLQILFHKTSYYERVFEMLGIDTKDLREHLDLQESVLASNETENKSVETDLDLRFKVKYRQSDQRLSYLEMHSLSDLIIQYVAALHPSHSKEEVRDRGGFENLAAPDDEHNCFRLLQVKGTHTDIVIYSALWVKNIFNSDNLYLDIAEIFTEKSSPKIHVGAHQGSALLSFLHHALRLNDVLEVERLDKTGWFRLQASNHKGFPLIGECESSLYEKMHEGYQMQRGLNLFRKGYERWISKHKVEPLFFLLATTFSLYRNCKTRLVNQFFRVQLAQLEPTFLGQLIGDWSLDPDPLPALYSLFHLAGFLQSDPRRTSALISANLIEYKIGTSYFYFPISCQSALNTFLEKSYNPYLQQIFFYLLPPKFKDNGHAEIDARLPLPVLFFPPQKYTPIIHYMRLYLQWRDPKIKEQAKVGLSEIAFIHLLPLMHVPGIYSAFEEILGPNFFPEIELSLPKERVVEKWLDQLFFSPHSRESAFLIWELHFTPDLFSFTLNLIKKMTKHGDPAASRLYFLLKIRLEKEGLNLYEGALATEFLALLVECSHYGKRLRGHTQHHYQAIAAAMQLDLITLCHNSPLPSLESIDALMAYTQISTESQPIKNQHYYFALDQWREYLANPSLGSEVQRIIRGKLYEHLEYLIEQLLQKSDSKTPQAHFSLACNLATEHTSYLVEVDQLKIFLRLQQYALKNSLPFDTLSELKRLFGQRHFLIEELGQEEQWQVFQLLLELLYQKNAHFDEELTSLFFCFWSENIKRGEKEKLLALLSNALVDLSPSSPLQKFIQLYLRCSMVPQQSSAQRVLCEAHLLLVYPLIHHEPVLHLMKEALGGECFLQNAGHKISQEWMETLFFMPQVEEHAYQLWETNFGETNFDPNALQFTLQLIEKLLPKDLLVASRLYMLFKASLKRLYEKKLVTRGQTEQFTQMLCRSATLLNDLHLPPTASKQIPSLESLSAVFAKDLFMLVQKNKSLKKEIQQALLLYTILAKELNLRQKLLKLCLDHLELDEKGKPKEREVARELLHQHFIGLIPSGEEKISQERLTQASRLLREKHQFLTSFEHLTYLLILQPISARQGLLFTDELLIFSYLIESENEIHRLTLKDKYCILSLACRRLEKKEALPGHSLKALTAIISSSDIPAHARFQLLHLLILQKYKICLHKEEHSAWCHYLYNSMQQNTHAKNWRDFCTLFLEAEAMGTFPSEIYPAAQLLLAEHIEEAEIQKRLLLSLSEQLPAVNMHKFYALVKKAIVHLKIEEKINLLDKLYGTQKESFGLVPLLLSILEEASTLTCLDLLLKHPFPKEEATFNMLLSLLEKLPPLNSTYKEATERLLVDLINSKTSAQSFKKLAFITERHKFELKFKPSKILALKQAVSSLHDVEHKYIKPLLRFFDMLLISCDPDFKQIIYQNKCEFITKIKLDKILIEFILKDAKNVPEGVSLEMMPNIYKELINHLLNCNIYAVQKKLEFSYLIATEHPQLFNSAYPIFNIFFFSLIQGKELLTLLSFFQKNELLAQLNSFNRVHLLKLKIKIINTFLKEEKIKNTSFLFDLIIKNHMNFRAKENQPNKYDFMNIFNQLVKKDYRVALTFFHQLMNQGFFEKDRSCYYVIFRDILEICVNNNKSEHYFDFLKNSQKYIFVPLSDFPDALFEISQKLLETSSKFFSLKTSDPTHYIALQENYSKLLPLFTQKEVLYRYGEVDLMIKMAAVHRSILQSLFSHQHFASVGEILLLHILEDSALPKNYWDVQAALIFTALTNYPLFTDSPFLETFLKKFALIIDKEDVISFPYTEVFNYLLLQPDSVENCGLMLDYFHIFLKRCRPSTTPWKFFSITLSYCSAHYPTINEDSVILKVIESLKRAVSYYLTVSNNESEIISNYKFTFMLNALILLNKRLDRIEALELITLIIPLIPNKIIHLTKKWEDKQTNFWELIVRSLNALALAYPNQHETLSLHLIESFRLLSKGRKEIKPTKCHIGNDEITVKLCILFLEPKVFHQVHMTFIKELMTLQNQFDTHFSLPHSFENIISTWARYIFDSQLELSEKQTLLEIAFPQVK